MGKPEGRRIAELAKKNEFDPTLRQRAPEQSPETRGSSRS
jgi:hypothetical protein